MLFGSTYVDLFRVFDELTNEYKFTTPLMDHTVLQEHDLLAVHVTGTAMVFTLSCEQLREDGHTSTSTSKFSISLRGHETETKGQFIVSHIELKM